MGFLKKITRPISRVLDKIVPNEIKPALPFLAAAAPFMAPGIMGAFGNSMLSRGLISGGLNLGSQLAQEGSDGDFSGLSTLMAAATGALSTPKGTDFSMSAPGEGPITTPSAGDFFKNKAAGMDSGLTKSGLGALEKSSNYLTGVGDTLQNNLFSKEGLKAALVPVGQGMTDLAVAENRRALKAYEQDLADYEASMGDQATDEGRALAIRTAMLRYGFTEDEITDTISSAGYRAGGRVGYAFGNFVKGSGVAQPVSASMNAGNRPMMSGSGMGGMLSNMINNNPQLFSNLTGQGNNSVSNMSRDFIDLNENGIDDRQEKAIGGRVGLKGGGMDAGQMYITEPGIMGNPAVMEKIENMREFMIANPDIEDITDYSEKYKDNGDSEEIEFKGIKGAVENIENDKIANLDLDSLSLGRLKELMDLGVIPEKEFNKRLKEMGVRATAAEGGLMNLGGREMDMRGGGFIPIGKKERADDVPARLSKNEFVMTADAVRAAGGGSVNEGAKRMYETMNRLEARA